jgi:hypothetical protein
VAQSAGVKPGDLPDLTIKEVKVYVLKPEEANTGQGGANFRRSEQYASVVTASGIEGNYVSPTVTATPTGATLDGWPMPSAR